MIKYSYNKQKITPLTPKEIEEKLKETEEEMQVVLDWKKENEAKKPKDKRALSWKNREATKVKRRIDTVSGNLIYWKLRKQGKSHFFANLERNEFWAKCRGESSEESED